MRSIWLKNERPTDQPNDRPKWVSPAVYQDIFTIFSSILQHTYNQDVVGKKFRKKRRAIANIILTFERHKNWKYVEKKESIISNYNGNLMIRSSEREKKEKENKNDFQNDSTI